ncbi:MAG: ribonuclease III [Chthoniobacterales bacterium]|nr:ribonuclease III [Chthoniobacterales bacterium]
MNPLEQRVGHKFRNSLLLAEALTHPSLGHETQRHHFDNQRLEFLGDAVLQLVITEHLYSIFPREAEGRLTKLRSRLVSREALRAHASRLELGQFLMMGRGEEASGGRERTSTLADAFEALLGAIYLDTDLATARRFLLTLAADDLAQLDAEPIDLNPKGHLQEVLQAISPTSPVYELLAESGPEHEKTFIVRVSWEGMALGEGSGRSKKQAETAAALQAVQRKPWEQTATLEEIQANQAASASSA